MKKITYILIVALLTVSCEKTIDFKGKVTEPMLVVNSIISPDSTVVVEVSESRFFLEDNNGTKYIENADLRLIVNGQDKGKMVKFPAIGTYGTDYRVSAGDEVKIEVSAPGFTPVSSLTIIPPKPTILAVDTSSTYSQAYDVRGWGFNNNPTVWDTVGEFTLKKIHFKMKFQDKSNEKNYYRLIVKRRTYSDKSNSGGLIDTREYVETYLSYFQDVVFQDQNQNPMGEFGDIFGGEVNSYNYNMFSDELIDGKEYELQFDDLIRLDYISYKESGSGYQENQENPERTVYLIYLQEISADYYLYVRSMVAAQNVDGNPFVEPVQVLSNIENGIGIFGSYTSSEPYVIEFRYK